MPRHRFQSVAGQVPLYKLKPASSGSYTFTTTGSTDTYGGLYQGGTLLDLYDDSGDVTNFSSTCDVECLST